MRLRNFLIIGFFLAAQAQGQVIPQKIEKGLHDAGQNLENATKKLLNEANKSAKQADKKVRETSLYDDVTGAAQRAWTSFEAGLKKMFSSSPEPASSSSSSSKKTSVKR